MRAIFISMTGLMLLSGGAAQAAVSILVNKDTQQMTVSVDGTPRYTWPVSSGNPSHETPNGSFKAFRMEEDHYSKEFDEAPMPNAIFFTKQGHAIHGTDAVSRLGNPASHGCVRLSRANALKLWDLVKSEGLLSTTVTLTGSSRVALARNPRSRTTVARGDADAIGQPVQIAPQSGYSEDLNANTRSRQPSQDRAYRDQAYAQDQAYYGRADAGPMQRRIYQNSYGYQNGYGYGYEPRPRYQSPRGGYYYYAD
ncbi:L,D-transpeptidase [Afipia massiliensis]|uniref:L,D-transpeptidase n=1 Tax=Afipia massiliensis TaxID=211460 RepID=A0A4V6BFK3_9BRAD|nr:L,D-transpeptidase [Afipia massiliensis]TKT72223.1 L,D-transpeptidase [Afipia massiliensis]